MPRGGGHLPGGNMAEGKEGPQQSHALAAFVSLKLAEERTDLRTSRESSDCIGKSQEYPVSHVLGGVGCHQTKGLGTQRIASRSKQSIPSPSFPASPQRSCRAVATLHRSQQPAAPCSQLVRKSSLGVSTSMREQGTILSYRGSGEESSGDKKLPWRKKGKKKGQEGLGAAGRECTPVFYQLWLAGVERKLEGKVYSADSLVGQHIGGQATIPTNASILLRFKRGNVLFISHQPVEIWQPLDGSDPTGILATRGCLFQPLNWGCSQSKRPKVIGSKRKKKSCLPVFRCFRETASSLVMAEDFRTF